MFISDFTWQTGQDLNALKVDDVTDEVDDDGDLEGGGGVNIEVGDVEARLGGVTQTVSIVSYRAPGTISLTLTSSVNWNMKTENFFW